MQHITIKVIITVYPLKEDGAGRPVIPKSSGASLLEREQVGTMHSTDEHARCQ